MVRAMNGNVKFEDALAARLEIIKPSKRDVKACLKQHPPRLTRGACVSESLAVRLTVD